MGGNQLQVMWLLQGMCPGGVRLVSLTRGLRGHNRPPAQGVRRMAGMGPSSGIRLKACPSPLRLLPHCPSPRDLLRSGVRQSRIQISATALCSPQSGAGLCFPICEVGMRPTAASWAARESREIMQETMARMGAGTLRLLAHSPALFLGSPGELRQSPFLPAQPGVF